VKLYSYVVAHDYGFAPNPFGGFCTLATCKPGIRKGAALGDYIVGTGCSRHKKIGHLIYFMRVEQTLTFDEYWTMAQFACKRSCMRANRSRAFGDNIYHRDPESGLWIQESSFHSHPDGTPHPENTAHDTQSDRVLIGKDFAYWGTAAPKIPPQFRNYEGDDICKSGQGYRVNFVPGLADDFIAWIRQFTDRGCVGRPLDWAQK
jgi:hypothetical protein